MIFIAVLTLYHFSSLHMPLIYVESAHLRHFLCIRLIISPLSSLSSSTDELRQGAKQLSRGVEQYYLSTEVSLLVLLLLLLKFYFVSQTKRAMVPYIMMAIK